MASLTELEQENKKLHGIIADLDKSAKMLVRRDLELRRANTKLESLDKEKSEFVSIAAHQLRTPLSAVKWAHQMLLDDEMGELNAEQKLVLEQAEQSVGRMISLVNDLLNADHLEFGQVVYEQKSINIALVLKDALSAVHPLAADRNITLSNSLPAEPVPFFGDPEKLKETFLNILSNAIKYTAAHGSVSTTLKVDAGSIVIVVSDTGIGIPLKDHSRIFKKFSRADNAKKIDADGSGLGLFIVKKIIEAHDGTVQFVSREGEGTTFTITLPLHEANVPST